MSEDYEIHNGVKVGIGWGKEIDFAQTRPSTTINGVTVLRVRFGQESFSKAEGTSVCSDCGVVNGQYHVFGCDNEQCPICMGELIYCGCNNEENM